MFFEVEDDREGEGVAGAGQCVERGCGGFETLIEVKTGICSGCCTEGDSTGGGGGGGRCSVDGVGGGGSGK